MSAPSASAAPTRISRLRSLLPPKASGSRSSRLIHTSARPPSAAEAAASAARGEGRRAAANRGSSGQRAWHGSGRIARIRAAGSNRRPEEESDGHSRHPATPDLRGAAPGMERRSRSPRTRRLARSVLLDRDHGPRRARPGPPPRRCETCIYVLDGRGALHLGPDRTRGAIDADEGDFVYIPAGEIHVEDNASTRATRRRPVPELPRFDTCTTWTTGTAEVEPSSPDGRRRSPTSCAVNGLDGLAETPFPNDGWSGSRLTSSTATTTVRHQADCPPATGSSAPPDGRAPRGLVRYGLARPGRRRSGRRTAGSTADGDVRRS